MFVINREILWQVRVVSLKCIVTLFMGKCMFNFVMSQCKWIENWAKCSVTNSLSENWKHKLGTGNVS